MCKKMPLPKNSVNFDGLKRLTIVPTATHVTAQRHRESGISSLPLPVANTAAGRRRAAQALYSQPVTAEGGGFRSGKSTSMVRPSTSMVRA